MYIKQQCLICWREKKSDINLFNMIKQYNKTI